VATLASLATGPVAVASSRTSLAALLVDDRVALLRDPKVGTPDDDGRWTWSRATRDDLRAWLGCDAQHVAEVAALASLDGVGRPTALALVCGGTVRKATISGYGSALAAVKMAAWVREGDRLPGTDARVMASLRAAACDDARMLRRALALLGVRTDAPFWAERRNDATTRVHAEQGGRGERETDEGAGPPRRGDGAGVADGSGAVEIVDAAAPRQVAAEGATIMSEQADYGQQQAQKPQGRRVPPHVARVREIFRERARELAALFPKDGMTLVTRAAQTAMNIAAGLDAKVSAESIAEAAIACHHLGLEVGDQAYIYPFKGAAKLTIGPRGLIALAYRSGFVRSIVARSVFDGDEFDYNLGDNSISHRKATSGRRERVNDRGEVRQARPEQLITHAYCLIDTTTDGRILEVLTAEDLAFYRGFSKASNGPWFDNFEGMARKAATTRGLEFVPRSPLLSAALRETEEGTYEMPESMRETIDELIKSHHTRQGQGQAPTPADVPSENPAYAGHGDSAAGSCPA
jgi:recombination protein RecT